jgi:hypothetical protein
MKAYQEFTDADEREARERENARVYEELITERTRAENALKNITDVLERPDTSSEALLAMVSRIDEIDSTLVTKAIVVEGNGLRSGSYVLVADRQNLAVLLRTLLGDAIATSNRNRAALEGKLSAAQERVEEARRVVARFETTHSQSE